MSEGTSSRNQDRGRLGRPPILILVENGMEMGKSYRTTLSSMEALLADLKRLVELSEQ